MVSEVKKSAESTRDTILKIAAAVIHENGFRATGLNDILSKTGLTKGAFYHHFKSKAELGLAVAREVVDKTIREMWIKPLENVNAGVDSLESSIEYAMAANNKNVVSRGCPLCNLANEMAAHDEKICEAVRATIEDWRKNIEAVLKRDQQKGILRANIDCEQSAYFILSSLQGAIGLAKPYHSPAPFRSSLRALIDYLEGLKSPQAVAS